MRIAIVHHQAQAVEALRGILARTGEHSVAWVARSGTEALRLCAADRPDLLLMDLFLPVMDGVEAIRRIMREHPCPILVVTTDARANVSKVFDAMGAGALDAVSIGVVEQTSGAASVLLGKIRMLRNLLEPVRPAPKTAADPPLIAIGASTGGPAVLSTLVSALPSDCAAAVVIVQHVDELFAAGLARWLEHGARVPVRLARAGSRPRPGLVLLAASNDHLVLTPQQQLDYRPEPLDYPYRPSVDVFFDSLARHWSRPGLGILLTGMGSDGAKGLLRLREAGWLTLAQDAASCAVYGMPKAASELGAAGRILAPEDIAAEMRRFAAAAATRRQPR